MGDIGAGGDVPGSDDMDEADDGANRQPPSFDAARLAVARQWVADLVAERNLDPGELAALAIVRIADARGVALLASVGAGVHASVDAACAAAIRTRDALEPDPARVAAYTRVKSRAAAAAKGALRVER